MKKIYQRFRISELIAKRHSLVITEDENDELDTWINESDTNINEYEDIVNVLTENKQALFYNNLNIDHEWESFQKKKIKTVQRLRLRIIKYAAAIILPLILGGLFFNIYDLKTDNNSWSTLREAKNELLTFGRKKNQKPEDIQE